MELVPLRDLFEVKYGVNLELVNLEQCSKDDLNSINFVSRTENNNGVSAFVIKTDEYMPNPAHTISVAGGGSVLSSFYHEEEYYSGRDVYYLKPLSNLTKLEMLFYAYCITKNKYKYNYGRQANKTLKDILVPKSMPNKFNCLDINKLNTLNKDSFHRINCDVKTVKWKSFNLSDLFEISASSDDLVLNYDSGTETPYISSTEYNNGIIQFVNSTATNKAGTITANRGGSVGFFFFQPIDYIATPVDVRILSPKFKLDKYAALFMTTVFRQEKYRFNYSRKMGTDRLKKMNVFLPVNSFNEIDFDFMSNYIKSLPYSSSI